MKLHAISPLAALLATTTLLPADTEPGILWDRSRFEPGHMTLQGIALSSIGRIVTVGNGGVTRHSLNGGVGWITPGPDTHFDLTDVIWDGTQFIATGGHGSEQGIIMTSPDGVNWTPTCIGGSEQLRCIATNGTRILAMGDGGSSYQSTDSTSWTGSAGGGNDYLDLVWAGVRFVRVGNLGLVETSTDGHTWIARASGTTARLDAVAWSGTRIVAVGFNSAAEPVAITSPDGITWTPGDMSTVPPVGPQDICWTGSSFVASGWGHAMLTSPDGASWTHHSLGENVNILGLLWTGSRLIAVGDNGFIATTGEATPDETTDWTVRSAETPEPMFHSMALAEISGTDRIVTVGSEGNIFTSDNGAIEYIPRSSPTPFDLHGVTSTPLSSHRFIAVGRSGTVISSSNGITWSILDAFVTNPWLQDVCWFNSPNPLTTPSRVIAVANLGSIYYADFNHIDEGWYSASNSNSEYLWAVASGFFYSGKPPVLGSLIVAVGNNGAIVTSSSGTTWTTRISGTTKDLFGITPMNDGGFLVVGESGTVLRSFNGVDWTDYSTSDDRTLCDVEWTGSQFVAVGDQGVIFTSPSGTTWTRRYAPNNVRLNAIITTGVGSLNASGDDGVMLRSGTESDFANWIASQLPPAGQEGPDDDPNGDGVSNFVAYGHGIPAVAPTTAADLERLPRLVNPTPGQPVRLRMAGNHNRPADLIYLIEQSSTLAPGSWTEVFRNYPGQDCGSGNANLHAEAGTDFVEIEFPHAIGAATRLFYRTRMEFWVP